MQTAATPKVNPIYRVESSKKQVAISFDAAWGNEETAQLLDILDTCGVKATFFLVGDWVDKFPDDVVTIAQKGHDIGNHSNTHPHMPQLAAEEAAAEITSCNDKIKALTGKSPTLFLDKVQDGSIVLMHNGAKNTPAALPGIIKGIQDKGFEIVLIKDLIPEGEYYTDVQGEFHLAEN